MVVITHQQKVPGGLLILLEESTGLPDIWNTDPGTGRWGVRTGVFKVTEEWLRDANLDKLILNVTLSHEGAEEDRVIYPDGEPYIDPFGMYVYTTSDIGHKIKGRKDKDLRYELSKELPRELDSAGNLDRTADVSTAAAA